MQSVLIIDDDTSFIKLLQVRIKNFLGEVDFKTFNNLSSARTALASSTEQFDLVVLDQHLPDGRGVELLDQGYFSNLAVLAVSSDADPKIPGASVKAGATYFLSKTQITEPLFESLILGIMDRNRIQRQLDSQRQNEMIIATTRKLVATLRHEINNPLGAVLGAAYIVQSSATTGSDTAQAASIVEASGKRIKHVLDQLCDAVALETVTKAHEEVFHIPGDKPWDAGNKE